MNRILIVAPYASLRAGLDALLADDPDCAVVGAASGSEELEHLLHDTPADILLLDMGESDNDVPRLLSLASEQDMAVIMLGEQARDISRLSASDISAWAYLRRDADSVEIAGAMRAVSAGLVALDRTLIGLFAAPIPPVMSSPLISSPSMPLLPGETLTAREREVLQLIASGLANKQIAGKLSISLHTVKFHVASILAKLSANSRTEAVTQGARRGLVTL